MYFSELPKRFRERSEEAAPNPRRSETRRKNHRRGLQGEDQAAAYLTAAGYVLLERNWRFHRNEIDIIAMDGEVLAFIEVKKRRDTEHGYGCQAVDFRKQQRIRRVAEAYLQFMPELPHPACRFDVVSIDGEEITLFKNAF